MNKSDMYQTSTQRFFTPPKSKFDKQMSLTQRIQQTTLSSPQKYKLGNTSNAPGRSQSYESPQKVGSASKPRNSSQEKVDGHVMTRKNSLNQRNFSNIA